MNDAVRVLADEFANVVLFFGIVLTLGTFLAGMRWMYARKMLHPSPPKPGVASKPGKVLSPEQTAWFEAEEIESGDAMVGLPFLAVVCFVLAAVLRFWPW